MFDKHPTECEATTWLHVGAWSLLIFASIPLACVIQGWVHDHWGRNLFIHGIIATIFGLWLIALLIPC